METKIIRSMPISGKEYMKMKTYGLKGYKANCECFDELKIDELKIE